MEAQAIPTAATPVLRELAPAVGTGVAGMGAGAVGVTTGGAVGTYTGQIPPQALLRYLYLRQAGREQRVQRMLDPEPWTQLWRSGRR